MPRPINWNYWEALGKAVRSLVERNYTVAEIAEELRRQEICTPTGKPWAEANLEWAMRHRLSISTATYQRRLPSRRRRAKA